MSDDASHPKRKIKKMIVESSSESDSDESVGPSHTRKKKLRVLSDNESDSSSGSCVVRAVRRRRALPTLRDSDHDGDSSGWGTEHSEPTKLPHSKPTSGFCSDSSEGNSDKCSICLMRFTTQEVGTPQNCEHIFCLDCITEWSKNVNTCPVDRIMFTSIVVRACAGGRVLRTDPVKVMERRLSLDMLVVEDPTVCEICGSADNEESMLLCDDCDLGYHMHCLTPPILEIPMNNWFCPNCIDNNIDQFNMSGVTDMLANIVANIAGPVNSRRAVVRQERNGQRSLLFRDDEPSTSSGYRGSSNEPPTVSRGTGGSSRQHSTRQTTNTRRKYKRRRTKTVIVEYEVKENGKFPVTKRVKRKIKKRRTRKQPRTAARRTHVRASVRAKLASMTGDRLKPAQTTGSDSLRELSLRRHRAGIPTVSLFGNHNELDYFSEEEHHVSEGATTAVTAARPTSNILSAYRQARRKMISISSPPEASSAPDILSGILESQSLLHSTKSVVSISVDGQVNITLRKQDKKNATNTDTTVGNKKDKVDLSQAEDAVKKVPLYPGQRGGGWGGGYRGNYHRDQGSNNFNRGNNYDNNNYGGGYQNRQNNFQQNNNNSWRDEGENYSNQYIRRPHQYSHNDESHFDRSRRPPVDLNNRGPNPPAQRFNEQRHSWQPNLREPSTPHRHSFGGFENPLDMRMGHAPPPNTDTLDNDRPEPYFRPDTQAKSPFQPLPEPPTFKFKASDLEKSEDEKSDSGLVIDTDKYDPTEPTNDDDSGDERGHEMQLPQPQPQLPQQQSQLPLQQPQLPQQLQLPQQQSQLPQLQPHQEPHLQLSPVTVGLDVPSNVLDNAVRQVLKEHRNLIVPSSVHRDKSDEDSDGDCPNFSIYSATSVHIANTSNSGAPELPKEIPEDSHDLADLVQEDDDASPSADMVEPTTVPNKSYHESKSTYENTTTKKSDVEYNLKVSKRCPITTNTRNPIKIKLNTPSLIKRQVTLYDDEEVSNDAEPADKEPFHVSSSENKDKTKHISEIKSPAEERKIDSKCSDKECNSEDEATKSKDEITEEHNIEAIIKNTSKELLDSTDKDIGKNDHETINNIEKSENESASDDDMEEFDLKSMASHKEASDCNQEGLEKMTESISETEDERSYTPCLDENKSKDTSLETEREKGIEGLDTEMISEDEGNEMFSDEEPVSAPRDTPDPPPVSVAPDPEPDLEPEPEPEPEREEIKKKKKKDKDTKKDAKEKSKTKNKRIEVAFKKPSKSGRERNYRDRDKTDKDKEKSKNKRERRASSDGDRERPRQRRKEKRKDLERYDVRSLVSERRRKPKDAFGRDVSPRASRSPSAPPARSPSPRARSPSPPRRRARSSSLRARSPSPPRRRVRSSSRSVSPLREPSGPKRRDPPRKRRKSRSASRARRASPPSRRRRDPDPSPKPKPGKKKKRSRSQRPTSRPPRRRDSPRRRSPKRKKAKRASPVREPPAASPPPVAAAWSPLSVDSRLLSPRTPPPEPEPAPLTPAGGARRERRRRRDPERPRRRRIRDLGGPSKEVFTSGDNILVSVSFKDQDRDAPVEEDAVERRERRAEAKRERRKRRRRAAVGAPPDREPPKPVAIIDLERSPFRELTPSPKNVIVLSDSDGGGDKELEARPAIVAPDPPREPPFQASGAGGPKTPPEPSAVDEEPEPHTEPDKEDAEGAGGDEEGHAGPNTPPDPPSSPDAYDPYEPTRSASASPRAPSATTPAQPAPIPERPSMTLEAAQKTNLSADEVLDRRPLSPMEKVLALLQSTRDVSPEPPPAPSAPGAPPAPLAPAAPPALPVRAVLPSPTRAAPKLFLAKPSPIKSTPIKPLPSRVAPAPRRAGSDAGGGESPYSPGSSDFGDLFEPPAPLAARRDLFDALMPVKPKQRKDRSAAARVPVKLNRKKGKTQVGVKVDEDNLKILDDLPSSAVEMQVKSKFLKKLNRQERVVEEVKLVLKPHYNKKHVTKEEYKDVLRRAVPKICHNKTGEINPAKIQALVEAYVKKIRKKHKLGLV